MSRSSTMAEFATSAVEAATGDVQLEASGSRRSTCWATPAGSPGRGSSFRSIRWEPRTETRPIPPDPVDQPDPATGNTTDNDPAAADLRQRHADPADVDQHRRHHRPLRPRPRSASSRPAPCSCSATRAMGSHSGQAAIKVMNPGTNNLTTTFGPWRAIPAHFPPPLASAASGGSWLLDATAPSAISTFCTRRRRCCSAFRGSSLQRADRGRGAQRGRLPQPFEDPAGNLHIAWVTDARTPGARKDSCLAYTAVHRRTQGHR